MNDLRQSLQWANYLTTLGWEYMDVDGNLIYTRKFGPSSLVKIQRPKNITREFLKKISEIAVKRSAMFVKIEPSDQKEIKLLETYGYQRSYSPLLAPTTLVVNLTKTKEQLWKNLKKDAKHQVNLAKQYGLTTTFSENPPTKIQEEFHKVLLETGKRDKFFIQPLSDVNSKISAFKNKAVISLTKNSGTLASSLTLISEDTAYYMHAGTTLEGRNKHATYIQIWDLILYLKELGIKKLDLEGISDERFPAFTKNWAGFSFFKRKFGGEEVKFPAPYIKYFNKTLIFLSKFVKPLPL